MDCLIKGNKKFNTRVILLISVIILCSCWARKNSVQMNYDALLEIHFQDFFKGDRIDFTFNKCKVFEDIQLYSDSSTGLTDIRIRIVGKGASGYELCYSDKIVLCRSEDQGFDLAIKLNGNENRYTIQLDKGKYIGFSRESETELHFRQSLKPFVYD